MAKCNYCDDEIPKDRYVTEAYKEGIKKGYCNESCKGRAGTLRMGIKNKKYMPLNLDEVDYAYLERLKR